MSIPEITISKGSCQSVSTTTLGIPNFPVLSANLWPRLSDLLSCLPALWSRFENKDNWIEQEHEAFMIDKPVTRDTNNNITNTVV